MGEVREDRMNCSAGNLKITLRQLRRGNVANVDKAVFVPICHHRSMTLPEPFSKLGVEVLETHWEQSKSGPSRRSDYSRCADVEGAVKV